LNSQNHSQNKNKQGENGMKLLSANISRRMLVAGAAAAAIPARAATKARPRALALIGDRYHNPDYIHVSLDKVFHELDIPIDYTMDYAGCRPPRSSPISCC